MNGYRNPKFPRQTNQQALIHQFAGQTAIWRQYVSASAGIPAAGIAASASYRSQTITGVFGGGMFGTQAAWTEKPSPAGLVAAGMIQVTTRQQLSSRDYIIWQGIQWRVDTDSQPARMNGYWVSTLVRGGEN